MENKKILVITAHPDDEILGVGGTLCKHISKGDIVNVCIVTNAYGPKWSKAYIKNKIKEQKKVDEFLGIKRRINLDLPTVKLNTLPCGELNKKITDVIEKIRPDIVYTHYEHDLNYDHTLVFRACMVATRPVKRKTRLMCFETLSETEWGYKTFRPNVWVDITKFVDKKIKAFKIYKSEVKLHPHPRSEEGIRILAKKRGAEALMKYSEGFILLKDYW